MSQPKVLIAFYSRSGVTEAFANAIAASARASGAEARLRRAREFVSADVRLEPRGLPCGLLHTRLCLTPLSDLKLLF
jgi:NAD(P)H dehydrogenase (quinone)